jgi:hypothetical protein
MLIGVSFNGFVIGTLTSVIIDNFSETANIDGKLRALEKFK